MKYHEKSQLTFKTSMQWTREEDEGFTEHSPEDSVRDILIPLEREMDGHLKNSNLLEATRHKQLVNDRKILWTRRTPVSLALRLHRCDRLTVSKMTRQKISKDSGRDSSMTSLFLGHQFCRIFLFQLGLSKLFIYFFLSNNNIQKIIFIKFNFVLKY